MKSDPPLLEITGVERRFGGEKRLFASVRPAVHAVQDISLQLNRGETLGIVGESGCGKSTLARLIVGLDHPTDGIIRFAGEDVTLAARKNSNTLARKIQYVFQDPIASLNPRKTIRATLEAPLIHLLGMSATERAKRLPELLEAVNLAPEFLDRYPHEFSGGQAQRIAIARALAANPSLIVLDEPVSALDVSVQAQVLNLLKELKQRFNLTYVFISHDLSVVQNICDRVAVMYFGRLAEIGQASDVFARPRHPYTHLLLQSVPTPGRQTLVTQDAQTELPDPYNPPIGCAFAERCERVSEKCRQARPTLAGSPAPINHQSACYHPHDGE
ncbi:MAG: oligopeptide/dipeptide ABC transporter ATP-binding protein [Burkholderiaceae bacterium]